MEKRAEMERMRPFTPEQAKVLSWAFKGIYQLWVDQQKLLRRANTRIAALQNLLVSKGIMTLEELEGTENEIEAMTALEEAFSPEIQTYLEILRRVVDGASEPEV